MNDRRHTLPGTNSHRVLWLAFVLMYGTPLLAQRDLMTFGGKAGVQLNPSFHHAHGWVPETNYHRPILGFTFE